MDRTALEAGILNRGREFFAAGAGETPAIFRKEGWIGTVLDRAMRNEDFKIRLFRFVDVLPCLASDESLMRHLREYFGADEEELIAVGGRDPAAPGEPEYSLAAGIRRHFETMARQFVLGQNLGQSLEAMKDLRQQGLGFTTDILGEAAVSENEASRNQSNYLALLAVLAEAQAEWDSLPPSGSDLDWGCAPRINISIKPTSLYSQARPADFEHSVQCIHERFVPLVARAAEIGAFICIDMEQYVFKDITLEVYRRLRTTDGLREHCHLGVVLQSYLKDTDRDLAGLLSWARQERVPVSVRLVKGAYRDYELIVADQNGWEAPVYQRKSETDAAWERQAFEILKNHDICHFACATHNVRSIAAVCEMAAVLKVPDDRYEFQLLYSMAGPINRALQKSVGRVRLYSPYGEMLPGMAYLVRRLLENTASESFLRRRFVDDLEVEKLLENPEQALAREKEGAAASFRRDPEERGCPPWISAFRNEPAVDFTRSGTRRGFLKAIADVRRHLGEIRPVLINNRKVTTGVEIESLNPANPLEIVGRVAVAGRAEIVTAISGAREAAPAWSGLPARERAEFLFRAGQILRDRIHSLAAWQILEVGKQWDQSWADVTEAIDFLEYYGREMIHLDHGRPMAIRRGEDNRYFYRPKGLTAVIAPWNFPMAISAGMCAAALVAGNCVVYKPSSLSAVCGSLLATVFLDAGLPPGVFQFLPLRGSEAGDFLVDHPDVHVIAFTGSMEVGRRIVERAAKARPGQQHLKKVIAEMGGKNAIIIDDDADLDQAVPHVLASAFGYQGQKCSACSRVIVLEVVYERFVARLLAAARSVQIGPAEDPSNFMGPLVNAEQQEKVLSFIKLAADEGEIIFSGPVPDAEGYYVPMTIVGGVRGGSRMVQEEIFGPVLVVMPASSFAEALEIANAVQYGLTGGIFSRSPSHVEKTVRAFEVGNLYLNRGITGALVGRQPFGGLKLSGIGSKAGGPDYLLQFLDPVSVCENTMRRGFAP
jgi:RHH-type transcriptional regulator, proline utilization regulon repressor / proline dehydrogenase / delta 1-pyrroline-5-carboxylate dehydrogenase